MKKRVLSMVLTLAMLLSAMTVLSFVSFGAGEAAQAVEKETVYAYHGTNDVNGAIDHDEPFTIRSIYLSPKVTMAVTWDYDNVYVIVYQLPRHPETDYLKGATFTIGGATLTISDWTKDTTASVMPEGAKAFVGQYEDKTNFPGVIVGSHAEFSIPMDQITLTKADATTGLVTTDMSVSLSAKVGGADTVITKNYDLVLSGRSLAQRANTGNVSSPNDNASGFGLYAYTRAPSAVAAVEAGVTKTNSAGTVTLTDANTSADNLVVQATVGGVAEFVDGSMGVNTHVDLMFTVKNLPKYTGGVGITAADGETTATNPAANIAIYTAARTGEVASQGVSAYIYNKNGTLMIAYYNGKDISEVALGVEQGEMFRLGFDHRTDGYIHILVNEKVIATDAKPQAHSGVGARGFIWIATKRANNSGNYSLNTNGTAGIQTEETISCSFENLAISVVNDVDVSRLLSSSKNGGAPAEFVIFATEATDVTAANAMTKVTKQFGGNVGSLTNAYVLYDTSAKKMHLVLINANIDSFDITVGNERFKVSYTKDKHDVGAVKSVPYITPTLETTVECAEIGMDAAYATTTITIPLDEIKTYPVNGEYYTDISIKAVREGHVGTRASSILVGEAKGYITYFDWKVAAAPLAPNMSSYNESVGGSGRVTYVGAANARSSSSVEGAGTLAQRNARLVSFKFTATAMQAYDVSTIKADSGLSHTASPQDRVRVSLAGCWMDGETPMDKGAFSFTITNTTNGGSDGGESLVVVYTDINGNYKIFPLDKKVGDTVYFEMFWDMDNSGYLMADDKILITPEDVRFAKDTLVITSRNTGMLYFESYRPTTSNKAFNHTVTEIQISTYTHNEADIKSLTNQEDEKEFPVELRYVQESKPVGDKFNVRFVSSVDSLDYGKVGHKVYVLGSQKTQSVESNIVYTSILANGDNGITEIKAEDGKYFLAVNVNNVDVQREKITFIVVPFVKVENVITYGQGYAFNYYNGEYGGESVYNGVQLIENDFDPFVTDTEVSIENKPVCYDTSFNSVIFDMGEITNINRAKLSNMKENVAFFNKSFAGLYYSEDGVNYNYISDYSVFQSGKDVYFYNFDVEARYLKLNCTVDNDYLGEARMHNMLQDLFVAEYSDKPFLAEDGFGKQATVNVTNNTNDTLYNQIEEFTLEELGIKAADLKEDKSDIRFVCNGQYLPHYYYDGTFYVRVLEIPAEETVEIKVIYSSETALDVSYGDEVFEIQYGNKYAEYLKDVKGIPGWQNSVATMPNGDVHKMVFKNGGLLQSRSTDGGATWSAYEDIPGTEKVTHGGGYIVDNKNGVVFYFGLEYYGDKNTTAAGNHWDESICEFMIYKSVDNGYTWTGPIEADGFNIPEGSTVGRYYSITYSDGITLKDADGEGPNVDYVISCGHMTNKYCSFGTTVCYSEDGGKTWKASDTVINFDVGTDGVEMGLSEEAIYEQEDGTIILYARCQMKQNWHFAISYSKDHGKTWSQITADTFSNVYTTNTQPIIETLNGSPVLMWGGNNCMGGTSYRRFPLSMATSDTDADTFKDIIDAGFQTQIGILDYTYGHYDNYAHTNPDLTFFNYGGVDSMYLVTCDFQFYIRDVENFLLKTKGAFDSFESGNLLDDGWLSTEYPAYTTEGKDTTEMRRGEVTIDSLGATEGNKALNIKADSVAVRTLHYMEKGKISFDYYIEDLAGTSYIELQSAFHCSRGQAAPVRLQIGADGSLTYWSKVSDPAVYSDSGLDFKQGNNTVTIEFDGNKKTAKITVNGQSADIFYDTDGANYISYIVVYNVEERDWSTVEHSTVAIDRFTAIKDENVAEEAVVTPTTTTVTSYTKNGGVTESNGTITYTDSKSGTSNRGYALKLGVANLKDRGDVEINLNINVNALPAVDMSKVQAELGTTAWGNSLAASRVLITATRATRTPTRESALMLGIYNVTGKGLVIAATYGSGAAVWVETAELGKTVNQNFALKIDWNAGGDLLVYVDGTLKATFVDYSYTSCGRYGMISTDPGVFGFNFCRNEAITSDFKVTISNVTVK